MTFYYLAVWQVLNNEPKGKVFKLEKTAKAYQEFLGKKVVFFKNTRISL